MTLHTHPQNIQDYENYFHRHLPLSIIRDFHQRTHRPEAPAPSSKPIESIITEAQAEAVAEWCDQQILLWLPFLPSAVSLRHLRNSSYNSPSLRFLECAQYLIAAQFGAIQLEPQKSHELRGIARENLAATVFSPLDDFAPVVLVMACTFTVESAGTSDAGSMGLLARQCTMRKTGDLSLSDRILEVLTATWQCISVVGDDDLIHQARAHASLVLPTHIELERLLEDIDKHRQEFSEANRNGAVGAVMRCRSWIMARETIEAISRLDPGDEEKQLAALQEVKDNWTEAIRPHMTRCRQLISSCSGGEGSLTLQVRRRFFRGSKSRCTPWTRSSATPSCTTRWARGGPPGISTVCRRATSAPNFCKSSSRTNITRRRRTPLSRSLRR